MSLKTNGGLRATATVLAISGADPMPTHSFYAVSLSPPVEFHISRPDRQATDTLTTYMVDNPLSARPSLFACRRNNA